MPDSYIDLSYDTQESEVASGGLTATITAITAADPAVITAANDFTNGDKVLISGVVGMVEINNLGGTVASASATSFAVTEIDSTLFTAYTSGGTASKIMSTTGDIRVCYDTTVTRQNIVKALKRAELLVEKALA